MSNVAKAQDGGPAPKFTRQRGLASEQRSLQVRIPISHDEGADTGVERNKVVSPVGGRAAIKEKSISLALLERNCVKKRGKDEPVDKWLAKTTHLHVEGENLVRIGERIGPMMKNLKYVYAYENKLYMLDPLPPKVEEIYVDNNCIAHIDLNYLRNLRTLSIKNNKLTNIDGIAECPIEELYLARMPMEISPHVTENLSRTLRILNMAHCELTSLQLLKPLTLLETVNVTHNKLADVDDVADTLERLVNLKTLMVAGNPLTQVHRFLDTLVLACRGPLEEIDTKTITNELKTYLKNIAPKRKMSKRKTSNSRTLNDVSQTDSDYIGQMRVTSMDRGPGAGYFP